MMLPLRAASARRAASAQSRAATEYDARRRWWENARVGSWLAALRWPCRPDARKLRRSNTDVRRSARHGETAGDAGGAASALARESSRARAGPLRARPLRRRGSRRAPAIARTAKAGWWVAVDRSSGWVRQWPREG